MFKNIAQFILFDRVWNILLNSSSAYIVFDQEKDFCGGCFQVEMLTKWCFGRVNIAGEC